MPVRFLSPLVLFALAGVALTTVIGCAAEPSEERVSSDSATITAPECTPAPKSSPGECVGSAESDALLDEFIGQCPFDTKAVSSDWTEDFGWLWWNPAQPGTTAAVGVELSTGEVVCT